jgi:hypothetical protein
LGDLTINKKNLLGDLTINKKNLLGDLTINKKNLLGDLTINSYYKKTNIFIIKIEFSRLRSFI